MKNIKIFILSLIVILSVAAIYTWPLMKHVNNSIPISAHSEGRQFVGMSPGDSLQLMYHFWLCYDMVSGGTPLFYDLYQFNTGTDELRYKPGPYYFPFGFVFSFAMKFSGSQPLSWNITILFSLIVAFLFSFMLFYAWSKELELSFLVALVACAFPYRLEALLGGSPTGFTMMWVPAIYYGIDRAIKNKDMLMALFSGLALLFCAFADHHVFFFTTLSLPCWCLLSTFYHYSFSIKSLLTNWRAYLIPASFSIIGVVYLLLRNQRVKGTTMAAGRQLREVSLFSPKIQGIFSFETLGVSNHIFIGWALLIAVGLIFGFILFSLLKDKKTLVGRHVFFWVLLLAAIMIIVVLALGTNGPMNGRIFAGMRKLIPPYAMIRQSAKIFCIVPTLLGLLIIMGISIFRNSGRFSNLRVAGLILMSISLIEFNVSSRPLVSFVYSSQEAYRVAAQKAEYTPRQNKGLAIPIWPGDSSWSSLYQHYASIYRLRMINGYSPIVTNDYIENVFKKLNSLNCGFIDSHVIQKLKNLGVSVILFHEDAYHGKVSMFPARIVLEKLKESPYLEFLKQDKSIWAFALREMPLSKVVDKSFSDILLSPNRLFNFERKKSSEVEVKKGSDNVFRNYLPLKKEGDFVSSWPTHLNLDRDIKFLLRVRGEGVISASMRGSQENSLPKITVKNGDWHWISVPLIKKKAYEQISIQFEWVSGVVDFDVGMVTHTSYKLLSENEVLNVPAILLSHSGYSHFETKTLTQTRLDAPPGLDGQNPSLYGFNLPLDAGKYSIEFKYKNVTSKAPLLGAIKLKQGLTSIGSFDVHQNKKMRFAFELKNNLPVLIKWCPMSTLEFIEVEGFKIEKIK